MKEKASDGKEAAAKPLEAVSLQPAKTQVQASSAKPNKLADVPEFKVVNFSGGEKED